MNKAQIQVSIVAEKEIRKYQHDFPMWVKHVCNIDLRAPQIVWADEVLSHNFVLCMAPPRMGKTLLIELINLYESAINPFEDGRIWAPKESQSIDSLSYQTKAIKSSEILWSYLDYESGKKRFSTVSYRFVNQSNWKVYGIYGEFEGVNATIIRGEEYDDLDIERFEQRVIPRGGAANRNGKPTRIRLTGTIQESKGNIYECEYNKKDYHVCTKFPVEIGQALGYYDENIINIARETLTDEQYERIYRLKYTAGRNFIWEEKLEHCQILAKAKKWEGIPFESGSRYMPMGHVFAGFDCGHSGASATASVFSLQVYEVIGDTVLWLNGKNWEGTTDPNTLIGDMVDWWYYYKIERGYGDALKSDLIAQMNDALYNARLIATDRQRFPENSATNWDKWDFSPKWNSGRAKYLWAGILKNKVERAKILIPRFDAKDDRDIALAGRLLCSRLLNVRENTDTKGAYPSLEYINPKLKDDDFDASIMAMGCINDNAPAIIDFGLLGGSGYSSKMGGVGGIGKQITTENREGFSRL